MNIVLHKTIKLIILLNIVFADQTLHYNIKYLGLNAADCHISVKDTIYGPYDIATKVRFDVITKNFFNLIYPINNSYSIILDDTNNILSFRKTTNQPGVTNQLKTEFTNNQVVYEGTNIHIEKGYYNIFSLLYGIMQKKKFSDSIIVEREGLIYDCQVERNLNEYDIYLNANDNDDIAIIKHTDIFTWALFKNNSKRKVIVNEKIDRIEKCIFKLGFTTMTANLVK